MAGMWDQWEVRDGNRQLWKQTDASITKLQWCQKQIPLLAFQSLHHLAFEFNIFLQRHFDGLNAPA